MKGKETKKEIKKEKASAKLKVKSDYQLEKGNKFTSVDTISKMPKK